MQKDPQAFLTIGEMSKKLGVRPHILRYWEEQFPMLTPLKRAGGRRLYRPSDSALLENIKDLIERQGFTIRGACQYLQQSNRNEKFDALATDRALPGAQLPQASPTHIVPGLLAIRARLLNALEQV